MLVQGVLAGLSLSSMYTLASATDLAEFLASYEVRAEDTLARLVSLPCYRNQCYLVCVFRAVNSRDDSVACIAKLYHHGNDSSSCFTG